MPIFKEEEEESNRANRTSPSQRVLVIAPQPFFEWRGSPIRVSFLLRALAESGFDVDLLCMPVGAPFTCPGVTVLRPPNVFGIKSMPIGPSLRKALFDLLLFMQTLFLAATRRYSAIHGIEDAGIIAALIGRIFSIPVVYEKHSDLDSYRGGLLRNAILRVYSVVERWTISLANAIIATGPGLAQQVKQSAPGANVHHIFDIPSSVKGADAERTSAVRGQLKKSPDEILVTYVGSFAVYQGIDLLFASIPKVLQTHTQARYIIIGGSKHEIAQRKNDLAQFGLAERVSFIGKIPPDDLPNYLAASDILLSPRIAGQNTPLKLLDYFAAGKPILAADTAANRLLLNESMALFADASPAAYADGTIRLLNDPELRAHLGSKGQQLVRNFYNFSCFKERLKSCYDGVIYQAAAAQTRVAAASAAMIRDADGNIAVWDVGAEKLYGFNAADAVGSISHDLLRTEFPEKLGAIEQKLEQEKKWEGELLHTTQKGTKLRVFSSWQRIETVDGLTQIFELNQPLDENQDLHGGQDKEQPEGNAAKRKRSASFSDVTLAASCPEVVDFVFGIREMVI